MKNVSLLDNIKSFLFFLEPSLDNIRSTLNVFDLSIDELLDLLKQDNQLLFWLGLVYAGLAFGALLDTVNSCGDVTSTINLPDFLIDINKDVLKDNVIPNHDFFKNMYINNMIFDGSALAYPVELLPVQADQINHLTSYFNITHGFQREFSLLANVNELIRISIVQGQNDQAAIDAFNELMTNQNHIRSIDNINISIGEMPSSLYMSLPFIPADLPLSETWNLRVRIIGHYSYDIPDVPHNMDEFRRTIRSLYWQVMGIEYGLIPWFNGDERIISSMHRRSLQALRYLEVIYRVYNPEYLFSWESYLDYDLDNYDESQ